MKSCIRAVLILGIVLVLGLSTCWSISAAENSASAPADNGKYSRMTQQIDKLVEKYIRIRKIPGVAVIVIEGDRTLVNKGYGYANLKTKEPVTRDTLFELASNTKAFTALGVLTLRDSGKLSLEDPVSKYLPWFYVQYQGEKIDLTIEQLLRHSTGIPFNSINAIPASEADNALEKAVRKMVGQELDFEPGTSFSYTSMNYDILGLIIEKISGQSFEEYLKTNVITPLGLTNTYLFLQEAKAHQKMALGYKLGFMQTLQYDAPRYRGNTPAGYVISNAVDMERWLRILVGTEQLTTFNPALIQEIETPNFKIPPNLQAFGNIGIGGAFYGMGFSVEPSENEILQEGLNPNFASFLIANVDSKIGVMILGNRGGYEPIELRGLGEGLLEVVEGISVSIPELNWDRSIDRIATIIVFVAGLLILVMLGLIGYTLIQLFQGKRKFQGNGFKGFISLILSLGFMVALGYCVYRIPDILTSDSRGMDWNMILVWGSLSIPVAAVTATIAVYLFYIHYLLISFFVLPEEKPFFSLALLSIASGMGNAFIIFTINAALGASRSHFPLTLFLYFILAMIIYAFGTRMVRKRMITITNDIVYFKRISMITHILKANYQKLEALEGGRIHAGLSNDTEVVSGSANMLIEGVTALITLLSCFVYLGILNIYGLLISVLVIVVAASLYFYYGKTARMLWEKTRDVQNVFFRFINDLVGGYKELYVNKKKQDGFAADMQQACQTYREKRLAGDFQMITVFVIGELLFTLVIGMATFAFPQIFTTMNVDTLRAYVLIFLFMTGPLHSILGLIPRFIQFRISWGRINQLLEDITTIESVSAIENKEAAAALVEEKKAVTLEVKDVVYRYQNTSDNNETFKVGPINCSFKSGEITFITGGNGTGKSTLAKLISGLYAPEQGEILINGTNLPLNDLSQNYSAVFSDFYLFEKLYGIDCQAKENEIKEYLNILRIQDKVQVQNGSFSTIKLSTGQKKRLALLVCFLEDRPVYLFDEWAVDQDAEFREYFYKELLPKLRERGKCIIAITHDDRYFHLADKVIKLEMGQIVA